MIKLLAKSVALSCFASAVLAQTADRGISTSQAQAQPGQQRPAMPFGTTADERSTLGAPVPTSPSPVLLNGDVQEQEHPEMRTGSAGAPIPDLLADAKSVQAQPLTYFESRAVSMNPTLRQAEAQTARLKAQARQQGLWQNPEVGYEADHIRGGSYAAGEQGGYVQQTIPLAGQRSTARAAVQAQVRQAEAVVQQQRERVRSAVDQAFYAALAAQQEAALRLQLAEVANDASINAHQLANVGQADAPDVLQLEVEREEAKLAVVVAQRGYRKAFAQLSAVCGGVPAIGALQGDLSAVPVLPLSQGDAAAESSPTLQVARQKIAAQDAALRSARRQAMPQLTLHAGLQQDNEPLEGGGRVGVVGVAQAGVILPLWNRNQGAVSAVIAERASAEAESQRTRLLLRARGEATMQDYAAAMETARRYREELLPRAERSQLLYQQKYAAMAAGYPQVLLSEKNLLQLRLEYVHALRDAWQSAVLLQNGLLQDGLTQPESVSDLPEGTLGGGGMR